MIHYKPLPIGLSSYAIVLSRLVGDDRLPVFSVIHKETGVVPACLKETYPTVDEAITDFDAHKDDLESSCTRPQVDKIMTLSTQHVKDSTIRLLGAECDPDHDRDGEDVLPVMVYPKGGFGWFIYLSGATPGEIKELPEDLAVLCEYALSNDCEILCLDCDARTLNFLPKYHEDKD